MIQDQSRTLTKNGWERERDSKKDTGRTIVRGGGKNGTPREKESSNWQH